MQAEKDLGVALIDIGGGSTDVAVYVEGEIYYSAVVPVGGNHVTADIATMLPTSYEEAERVKIEHGVALESMAEEGSLFEVVRLGAEEPSLLPKKDILAAVIEPRIEEIFSMAKQEIAKSGYLDLLPAGAVITGGGSLIPGTLDMAGQVLGMRVRPGRLIGVHGLVDTVEKPTHATSVGLVIWEKRQMIEHEETHQTSLLSSVLGNIKKRILG
jgi:cell division protein FtsA